MNQEPAVGYVRVSTDEQAREGISLNDQEQRIRAYATMRGLRLVKIFREEGVSGGIPLAKRPQGKILVNMLTQRTGPARHIIVVKLDRLFRSASDALRNADAWKKAKCALHFIDMGGNSLDTSTALGKIFFTMTAAFAELERDLTGERVRSTLSHLKAGGKVYCNFTPLGFDRVKDRVVEKKIKYRLVPNSREMATVKKISRLRTQGLSLGKIADALNRSKTPTKRGGTWYAVTVQKILANKIYQGRKAA